MSGTRNATKEDERKWDKHFLHGDGHHGGLWARSGVFHWGFHEELIIVDAFEVIFGSNFSMLATGAVVQNFGIDSAGCEKGEG